MKVGDLVRVKHGYTWRYNREWSAKRQAVLVTGMYRHERDPEAQFNIRVDNDWYPSKYFEVVSAA